MMVNSLPVAIPTRLSVFSRKTFFMEIQPSQSSGSSLERSFLMRLKLLILLLVMVLTSKVTVDIDFSQLVKIEDSSSMISINHMLMRESRLLATLPLNRKLSHLLASGIQRKTPKKA